jgi:hypothetical protein
MDEVAYGGNLIHSDIINFDSLANQSILSYFFSNGAFCAPLEKKYYIGPLQFWKGVH